MMPALAWITLFLPLIAAAAITLFARRQPAASAGLSIGAVAAGFVFSCLLLAGAEPFEQSAVWLSAGAFHAEFGILFDRLSALMMVVVTGVGGVIHVYSYGYMRGDPGISRYFASLSLFTFSMLGIVMANNFVQLFIFWELVGVSSYLLIGFWYQRPAAAEASKKAFLTNRLGDFGFLLGILIVWAALGSLNFGELEEGMMANPAALGTCATAAGLLVFCGAVGKSAQFPLHVWLPDAMEGPTPVSALIHAATMVAAGVYMLCRIFFLLNAPALLVVAWIGGITALLAALIALQQNDIKRILAYSTLSQLGYMVMAVGLSGPDAAMFHLTTHAFFKALLFLGAGSVILALHHEQDIWNMGGLRRKMPVTYWTFLLAALALCGVPPFSGFFSKDEVLAAAYEGNPVLFGLGVLVAALTTFYMFRLILVAFHGHPRSEAAGHASESPPVIRWPLVILAVPTVLAGFWGIDAFFARQFAPETAGEAGHGIFIVGPLLDAVGHAPVPAMFGLLAVMFGFSVAYSAYAKAEADPVEQRMRGLSYTLQDRFYFDEIYGVLIFVTHEALARLADFIDRWIIAGLLVRGAHATTGVLGGMLRLIQTGNLQTYAFLFLIGVAVMLYLMLG